MGMHMMIMQRVLPSDLIWRLFLRQVAGLCVTHIILVHYALRSRKFSASVPVALIGLIANGLMHSNHSLKIRIMLKSYQVINIVIRQRSISNLQIMIVWYAQIHSGVLIAVQFSNIWWLDKYCQRSLWPKAWSYLSFVTYFLFLLVHVRTVFFLLFIIYLFFYRWCMLQRHPVGFEVMTLASTNNSYWWRTHWRVHMHFDIGDVWKLMFRRKGKILSVNICMHKTQACSLHFIVSCNIIRIFYVWYCIIVNIMPLIFFCMWTHSYWSIFSYLYFNTRLMFHISKLLL